MGQLTKVRFDLHGEPVGGERVWAERVDDGLYRLRNIPYHAKGFASGDIVRCVERSGMPEVVALERNSGNLTIRIYFAADFDDPGVQRVVQELTSVGCTYEAASQRLVAFNVPPEMEVPFSQMVNYVNGIGEDIVVGWEIGKGPEA